MKNLLFAILFFCGIGSTYAQQVSTSEEEYNYLTKGYPESIEKGLELKTGYSLEKIATEPESEFEFTFYKFVENKNNLTKAILVVRYDKQTKKKKYACLPINNIKLYNRFKGDFNTRTESWINFYDASTRLFLNNSFN